MAATTTTDLATFTATAYGVDFGSLSADAEAVIRRCHEAGQAPALDLFRGLDGLVYVRFEA